MLRIKQSGISNQELVILFSSSYFLVPKATEGSVL